MVLQILTADLTSSSIQAKFVPSVLAALGLAPSGGLLERRSSTILTIQAYYEEHL
jgi:hypothetical protein